MKKVIWIAGHGPNRSHDTLNSDVVKSRREALAFVAGQGYWRISRMEYTAPYSPGKRTDEIGGVDVDQKIERIRFAEESRTMRRVSTKQALALWQKSMRSGPGGARKNPARKKKTTKRRKNASKRMSNGERPQVVEVAVEVKVYPAFKWDANKGEHDRSRPCGVRYEVSAHDQMEHMIGAPIGTGRSVERALADFAERAAVEYNYYTRKSAPKHVDVIFVPVVAVTRDYRADYK
jgi:hypothetical protein